MAVKAKIKHQRIVELFCAGKRSGEIFAALAHLGVTKRQVQRTLKRYKESGAVEKRHRGGPKPSATCKANVLKVKKRLRRNPRLSIRKLAKNLDIGRSSCQRILKGILHTKPFKIQKVHGLTENQKKVRLERVKSLKKRTAHSELPNVVFSDEKIFTIEQSVNKQNDRVWLPNKQGKNSALLQATRTQAAASVMVWGGVTATGRTPLVFLPRGVKVNGMVYREEVLEGCLKPWATKHFKGAPYTFQQDSAPSHTARATQDWLRRNAPGFITSAEWPPHSPDLNPLDFCIWGLLESKVCASRHTTVEGLKASLVREWKRLPQEVVRASCEAFETRLSAVIKARGGHIEL